MRPILSLFLILASSLCTIAQTNVLYGERDIARKQLALYYDREGTIYPDYFIANVSLEKSGSSLKSWYCDNPEQFLAIARKYGCNFNQCSALSIKILGDSIAAANSRAINSLKSKFSAVTFLVHGFRKPFVNANGDYTSVRDFAIMEKNISDLSNGKDLYVEVYWDAQYGCCFTANLKRNEELFKLFDQAQVTSTLVGKSLRTVLSNITFDTLNLYSQSLGARVVAQSLFNIAECDAPTPSNKRVNICMVAPAIAGIETFKDYYKRNSNLDFQIHDNYRLAIIYNDNDFVLLKRDNKLGLFGPGPYRHGNTSLGCNYHHTATKLEVFFLAEYRQSAMRTFNLSIVGKCHHVRCYFAGNNILSAIRYLKE